MAALPFGKLELDPRRSVYLDITDALGEFPVPDEQIQLWEDYDLIYRTLCGILYNFVPKSGHPGGSVSSGRIVSSLLFNTLDYRFKDPEAPEADLISYAAGHKAMGLYAMWALRNEVVRAASPDMLPDDEKMQLRLEDMLGFRRNPTQETPLFAEYRAKALDGHPAPLTPFIKLSTGASGVGVPSSFGLGFGAMDSYPDDPPLVHVLEGEGGMTAGRVSEALATAASANLWNIKLHLDWNQSSIDSDKVCREGEMPGDYVQWDPREFCFVHDWNVIWVPDGFDYQQVLAGQRAAKEKINDQPTAVVYRTVKGWQYGIEGRKSHGAGHGYLSEDFYQTLEPVEERFGVTFPRLEPDDEPVAVEQAFFDTLMVVRRIVEENEELASFFTRQLKDSEERLEEKGRKRRSDGLELEVLYSGEISAEDVPAELTYEPGSSQTLRGALGSALGHLNKKTGGAFLGAAADLLGSTSISDLNADFPEGFYNAVTNSGSRLIAAGGICEDNMGAFMTGVSSYGSHIGAASSYAAFIVALEHVAARLHGIGQQTRKMYLGAPYNTFIMVAAHAGLKTGEDGPTHADPQALQLVQENFPKGVSITLTPWSADEVYPMLVAALKKRPALLVPFVTRPSEKIADREALGLPPASAAVEGVYAMRRADPGADVHHGTLVLQGSGMTNTFVHSVLPRLDEEGLNMNVFYVSSAELFDLLPEERQEEIYPSRLADEAMGMTGLTLPTMYRWVNSREGRRRTVHAFRKGHYLGSGKAHKVLEEAELHPEGQWQAIKEYAEWMVSRSDVQ
ncbi:MAG: hypothetical protein R6W82_11615 [bacterium]